MGFIFIIESNTNSTAELTFVQNDRIASILMSFQIRDISDLPLHLRPRFPIGLLHPRDNAFADVHVDDGFDATIVNVRRQPRITAAHVQHVVFGRHVFVDDAAELWVFAVPLKSLATALLEEVIPVLLGGELGALLGEQV